MLFVGDVVGAAGVSHLLGRLPDLRRQYDLDAVVVDGDNCDVTGPSPIGGSGMVPKTRASLFHAGIDVVTMGGHAFDGPEASAALVGANTLRPVNLPAGRPGRGHATVDTPAGPLTVISLCSTRAFPDATNPWAAWTALDPEDARGPVIIHYVEGSSFEPRMLAHALDGEVAAVLGTWTHVPTNDLEILPGGTAVVGDVGYCGPRGGIGGFPVDHLLANYQGRDDSHLPPYELLDTPVRMDAVLLHIEEGITRDARRLPTD